MTYELQSVNLPTLTGNALRLFVKALETTWSGNMVAPGLLKQAGFETLRQFAAHAAPQFLPLEAYSPTHRRSQAEWALEKLIAKPLKRTRDSFQPRTVHEYNMAYRTAMSSPNAVLDQMFSAIQRAESKPVKLNTVTQINEPLARKAADASEARWKAGKPLSVLDGVPFTAKEEFDIAGYKTTVGTGFLGRESATATATCVQRLMDAGAILVGKTNMHEIGIGVTGFNPHHGTPRNPYNLNHHTGGSSSGAGAAVAAGLGPIAIGADGGGSIRIPAAFCGVAGLKPTFGRVSEFGAAPLCWSVAHIGPLGATVDDVAMAYALMAGPDPLDANTSFQPKDVGGAYLNGSAKGFRIGIYKPFFEHATADIVAKCYNAIDVLRDAGAEIVEIEIPNLEEIRIAHMVTIASEMRSSMGLQLERDPTVFGLDVRANLALTQHFGPDDYVRSQRIRAQAIESLNEIFTKCDVIATPSTAITAPPIPAKVEESGISNLTELTEIMRYAPLANLTGIPGLSVPVGYDQGLLPVGLQLMGPWWQEYELLRLGRIVEAKSLKLAPNTHYDPLGCAMDYA